MNTAKLENMSVTVPREEGEFWRRLSSVLTVRGQKPRSRGDLQKFLMLEGLRSVCRKSAKQLAAIRKELSPQALAAVICLFTLGAGSTCQFLVNHHHARDLRAGARVIRSVAKIKHGDRADQPFLLT